MNENRYDITTLQYLFEDGFFDIKIDRRGNVTDVSWDEDYDQLYMYDPYGEYDDVKLFYDTQVYPFVEALKKVKFYDNGHEMLIELSDNHTMWDITNEEIDEVIYWEVLQEYANKFEQETGVELYTEGRSGRHICVDFDVYDVLYYDYLKEVQERLEKEFVDELNNNFRWKE